jgi:MSHA biogenesis protein MshJ
MEIIIVPIKLNKETINNFNLLTLRLRVLLTLAASAVLFMLFDMIWFSDAESSIKKTKNNISQLVKQSNELINFQDEMNTNIINKKSNPNNKKLEKLTDEISSEYKLLENKTANLVKPEDMADVLKAIILSTKDLKITTLTKNKTEEVIKSNSKDKKNTDDKDKVVKLYKHSIEMVLSGNYSSTYQFLKNLEIMKKKVSFDQLQYTVDKHPIAKIKLTVSTISLQREWIGG